MRVFVTGGAGYVGSHCVRELCNAGHDVTVFDNLVGGHRQAVDPRATFVAGDLSDTALLGRTFAANRFDAVMHFAALLDVNESTRKPLPYYRNNVAYTVSLLELMQIRGIARLIFSSTCATYGVPPSAPITEDMPQHPINPYGRTKLAIEWALRDSAAAWGLGATALRYFNAAGAASDGTIGEDHRPEYHLIPVVLEAALGKREGIRIFGTDYPTRDGTCVRDYVHVEDLAVVHRLALESQPPGVFCYYNVGTGRGVSVRELVDAAREVTGADIPASPAPRREGDPPELYADPAKITRELGWRPAHTDIRTTIETAWRWHRSHPQGYGE
ncbi:MAG: UDP-glucose 4-epimerase GalE [Planctomycetes bacterium]|nr:UDP-glucose 4-epimerase GalE [Planctomycetota bacterium]